MPETPKNAARRQYGPFCRQGPHPAMSHHHIVTCNCPCHGDSAPWWSERKSPRKGLVTVHENDLRAVLDHVDDNWADEHEGSEATRRLRAALSESEGAST